MIGADSSGRWPFLTVYGVQVGTSSVEEVIVAIKECAVLDILPHRKLTKQYLKKT